MLMHARDHAVCLPVRQQLTGYTTVSRSAAVASSPLFLNLAMVEGSTSSPRASWQQCSTARRAGRLPAVVVADSHSLQQQQQ
jgi:hypothetical protein